MPIAIRGELALRQAQGERNQDVAHGELAEPRAQGERAYVASITTKRNHDSFALDTYNSFLYDSSQNMSEKCLRKSLKSLSVVQK